jgi:hypothetical protein
VASLQEAGANVRLIARRFAVKWNTAACRPAWKSWYPMSGLGGGWRNRFFENAPMLFRQLPGATRTRIVRTWLGPSGAWPVKDCVERAPMLLGHTPCAATPRNGRAHVSLIDATGAHFELVTDHVIAATGYQVDLANVSFLEKEIRSSVWSVDGVPVLSADFQSSVPGLYFVGLTAANTFGPVMRFVLGARYTARRLTRHVAGAQYAV